MVATDHAPHTLAEKNKEYETFADVAAACPDSDFSSRYAQTSRRWCAFLATLVHASAERRPGARIRRTPKLDSQRYDATFSSSIGARNAHLNSGPDKQGRLHPVRWNAGPMTLQASIPSRRTRPDEVDTIPASKDSF